MEILNYSDKKDLCKIRDLLKVTIESNHFIPVLGAGFSSGTETVYGCVPNVEQLQEQIVFFLQQTKDYRMEKKEELLKIDLCDLASVFWKEVDRDENKAIRGRFIDYIEENFTRVRDISLVKRKFLNSGWRYIYTLNYDDSIERNLEIEKIIPFQRQNKGFIDSHACLFKLHGDANSYIKTGEKKYCILSKQQYIDSMNAPDNNDMCRHLESDFASNSLMFIGCSLKNELDLLFAADIGLGEKTTLDLDDSKIIYIKYSNSDENDVDIEEKVKLINYGVTHVLIVHGDTEMDQFYQLICELNNSKKIIEQKKELEKYKGICFNQLEENNPENFDYFFINDSVRIKKDTITLPGFFVERKLGKVILDDIFTKDIVFHIVTGSRMSGKTYLLLQLLKHLPPASTYYLPIKINDQILADILQKRNCNFIMDQVALTIDQIQIIFDSIDQLVQNHTKIILAVNIDDKDLLEVYQQRNRLTLDYVKIHSLDKKLTEEIVHFNKHVAKLRLKNYDQKDTILDYLFKVEENNLETKHKKLLPQTHFLGNTDIDQLKAIIVLAVEKVIPMSMAIDLQIETALIELSKRYSITVQQDYLSNIESVHDNSRYKFVNNSPYWTLRCLSICAENSSNHRAIADAFYSLICNFEKMYQKDARGFNSKIKEYCMLDTLQTFFASWKTKGTLKLPIIIYERLHNKLYDNFQFLHQEAKCELRVARREEEEGKILSILQNAFSNINRAIDIGEKSSSENKMYSLNHMKVTKSLILSNYLLKARKSDKLGDTIQVFYEAFVEESSLLEEDFLRKEDLDDVKNFMSYIVMNSEDMVLDSESKNKFGEIYYIRYGKHISI